jgi:hypothetical protein
MRSRRHKLQVSTFPFLAVLLCAMGALLLVLLVMDRRAHYAARARAEQAARLAAEDSERDAAARRDALERAREAALAARRQERDTEHARLASQAAEVQGQLQSVGVRIDQAANHVRAEEADEAALKRKAQADQVRAAEEQQALIQVRADDAKQTAETEASRKAREEMTADLAQLERTLADLKAARDRGEKTYSVVPYNGKRGDNRRPIYVECTSGSVIFHPDRTNLDEPRLAAELQSEIERRAARQKEQLPAAQAAAFTPYLMLLVRPDGVVMYYRLREVLRALKIDFGYELVDQDWALDFPADDHEGPSQAWMTAAKPAALAPSSAPPGAPPRGVPASPAAPTVKVGRENGSPNSDKTDRAFATPSGPQGPSIPPPAATGPPRSGQAPGVGPDVGPGAPSAPGAPHSPAASPPSGPAAPGIPPQIALGPQSAPTGPGVGPDVAPPGASASLGTPSAPGPARPGASGPGVSPPTAPGPARPGASGPGVSPPTAPGANPAAGPGVGPEVGPAATAPAPGAPAAAAPAKDGPKVDAPPVPSPTTAAKAAAKAPSGAGPASANKSAPADGPEEDPFLRAPPSPFPSASRPAQSLRPARLSGDRDWLLYVECKPEGVVIYPTRLLVPLSALSRTTGANPLLQSVQQLIDHKQATVRPGDAPYRPEVRFLVHPDALRTYHLAYPTLDALAAPKSAQDLGPDDDVAAIVTGH